MDDYQNFSPEPDAAQYVPEPDAIQLVPEGIARMLRFAPVSAGARTLTIAVAAPLTGDHLLGIIELTGRQLINQIETAPAQVDAMIDRAYDTKLA